MSCGMDSLSQEQFHRICASSKVVVIHSLPEKGPDPQCRVGATDPQCSRGAPYIKTAYLHVLIAGQPSASTGGGQFSPQHYSSLLNMARMKG